MITVKTLASSSAGNAYLLESGDRQLLIECGIPFKELQKRLNFQVSRLDGCLVSHGHGDHSKSIQQVMDAGVDVYCTKGTFAECNVKSNFHRFNPVGENEFFHVGPWRLRTFDTVHDCEGSVGFVVHEPGEGDRLVFITDTGYCRYTFPGMTHLMVEANFSEEILSANVDAGRIDKARARRVRENHFSIERVVDLLKANDLSRLREIRLLHLSSGNSNEAMFKRMIQEVAGVPVIVEGE